MPIAVIAFLVALTPVVAVAQTSRWITRADIQGADSAVSHVQMPPGWHITTGPASILYDPANQGRGRFAIEAEVFLFPGESQAGYGVFVGGSDLDSPQPSWVAFLLTRDGSATIERRHAGGATTLFPVTRTAAVNAHTGEGTAHNVLRVLVQGDSVIFSANGQRITALSSRELVLEGTFGFRVGQGVNLHISNLDLVTRLAPFRR